MLESSFLLGHVFCKAQFLTDFIPWARSFFIESEERKKNVEFYSLLTALLVDQQQKFQSKCWSERARDGDTPSSNQEGFYCGHIRNYDFAERSSEGQEEFRSCLFHRTGPTD